MPPFDATTLLRQARQQGLQAGFFEKAARLLHILQLIGGDSVLAGKLSLRGGTAINLFFLQAARLSVDADLNYIGSEGRESMLAARPILEQRIQELAESQGYDSEVSQATYALGALRLYYTTVHGSKDFVKIEINYLYRLPLTPTATLSATGILPGIPCSFLVAGKEEVYSGKVKALLQRVAERDLFDVYRLLQAREFNDTGRIRYLATFWLATDENDARRVTFDSLAWPRGIVFASAINPMVQREQRVSYNEVRARVDPFVRSMLTWDVRQSAYLDEIAAGKPGGAALFPNDSHMASLIDRHPSTLRRLRREG